jgi:hypothetical protein
MAKMDNRKHVLYMSYQSSGKSLSRKAFAIQGGTTVSFCTVAF